MIFKERTLKFAKNFTNDWWMRDKFIRYLLVHLILPLIYRKNNGILVLNEVWDNLIILDACRYDAFNLTFERFFPIEGKLEKKISRGSNTTTFLLENFDGSYHDDIVYVTANPYVNKYLEGRFHAIVPVWKWGWDKAKRTVPPNKVYESALWAAKKYPTKRLIVHYLQPHPPFLNYDVDCRSKVKIPVFAYPTFVYKRMPTLSKEFLLRLHCENLLSTLPYVEKLVAELKGTCVITSDHGEALGEFLAPLLPLKLYGHLAGARIKPLIEVPWFIIQGGSKGKQFSASDVISFNADDESDMVEKLKALGYE